MVSPCHRLHVPGKTYYRQFNHLNVLIIVYNLEWEFVFAVECIPLTLLVTASVVYIIWDIWVEVKCLIMVRELGLGRQMQFLRPPVVYTIPFGVNFGHSSYYSYWVSFQCINKCTSSQGVWKRWIWKGSSSRYRDNKRFRVHTDKHRIGKCSVCS